MNSQGFLYTNPFLEPKQSEARYITFALSLSLLFHLLLIITLQFKEPEAMKEPIIISVITDPPLTKEQPLTELIPPSQIISESEAEEKPPTVPTAHLYEKDLSTNKEQIKRGVPASAPMLRMDDTALHQNFATNKSTPSSQKESSISVDRGLGLSKSITDEQRLQKLHSYEPFSRNNFFTGPMGSPDYLPSIPDGDITLLNAKADRYAVFVRRVAMQVFGALRKFNWQSVTPGEINKIRDFVTVKATLSETGKLLKVDLLQSSGSHSFDKVLLSATQEGAWDQNPPQGAITSEKTIEFIFKSRSWSQGGQGGLMEQRWLLLSTGLL